MLCRGSPVSQRLSYSFWKSFLFLSGCSSCLHFRPFWMFDMFPQGNWFWIEIDLMCSEVLSCWASAGAFGVRGGQVLCRHGPEAAGSEGWEEVVRRGPLRVMLLTPQALHRPGTLPISQLVTWRHGGGSRVLSEKCSVGVASFHLGGLPAFLPSCPLSVPPHLPREAGRKQPSEVGRLLP